MEILSLVAAPPVLAGAAFVLSALVALRGTLLYVRGADELRSMLARIEKALDANREQLPPKRERVAADSRMLPPLKQKHQRLLDYYNDLCEALEEEERNALAQELAEAAERKRRRRHGRGGERVSRETIRAPLAGR